MNDDTKADAQMVPNPSKAHRTLCTCGAEPEAYKLRTGIKLLADKVRSLGYENRKQESNGELVGRFIWDATPPAEVAALRAEVERLRAVGTSLAAYADTCVLFLADGGWKGKSEALHARVAEWISASTSRDALAPTEPAR